IQLHLFVYCLFYPFFIRAEDGIRVRNVTGVQTCALPICSGYVVRSVREWSRAVVGAATLFLQVERRSSRSDPHVVPDPPGPDDRSEERRGWEDCGARGGQYHLIK